MMKTSVTLPLDLWQAAKIQAVREQRDLQDMIAEALAAYLKGTRKESGR